MAVRLRADESSAPTGVADNRSHANFLGVCGNLSLEHNNYTPYGAFCQLCMGYSVKIDSVMNMETRLRELREDNDLTQDECARIAFISKNSYIRYEKGERIPPLDIVKKFAEYYGVSIDYIAKLSDIRTPIQKQ